MENSTHTVSIGLIETALNSAYGAALGSGEHTHEPALLYIGQLVQHSQNEVLIEAIVTARLPEDYSGNTTAEIPKMIESAIEKGFDQPEQKKGAKEDGKQSSEALALVKTPGMMLWHDSLDKTYATFGDHVGGSVVVPIESSDMKKRINYAFYKAKHKALSSLALAEVITTLNAQASYEGGKTEIHLRIGAFEDQAYIDRGDEVQSFIRLAAGEWSLVDAAPIKFRRSTGFGKLPIPTRGADPSEMQALLGLDDDNFALFVAFLLMCSNPRGPYMLLLVQSVQGSGKSYLCSVIKKIVDPSAVEKQRIPGTDRILAIHAKDHYLLSYDNASTVKNEMSDAFCTLATGGAFTTRKLYSDDEAQIFKQIRPVIMNGIGDFAYRPDLLERSIQLNLSPIDEDSRKTEREMDARFDALLPGFLGYLYDCAAYALANLDKVVPPRSIRMADAAHFVVAAEPATGFSQGRILQALERVRDNIMIDRAVNDSLGLALSKTLKHLPNNEFDGRVGELFDKIADATFDQRLGLPKSPSALSNALNRSKPMLSKIGLMIEFAPRSNQGSNVRVWLVDNEHREDHDFGQWPKI